MTRYALPTYPAGQHRAPARARVAAHRVVVLTAALVAAAVLAVRAAGW